MTQDSCAILKNLVAIVNNNSKPDPDLQKLVNTVPELEV